MSCCSIVPADVLARLANDKSLSAAQKQNFVDTSRIDTELRKLRTQARKLTAVHTATQGLAAVTLAAAPQVTVFDCKHSSALPGSSIANPGNSADTSAKRCFTETAAVADFYAKVFGRNSIDNAGMTMMSSIHYSQNYNNAMWNGTQMVYGDGDGSIFVDFTRGNDVIGHELTHGVTQYSLQLVYANEPGGLNESMSDVFGSMFRQWRANQTVGQADWLIGKDIMGPSALAKGITCLRDMANPKAKHCLAPQIVTFKDYLPGMDPHYSSGVGNLAFFNAATAIGGKSWEKTGKIWYAAMTNFAPSPNLKMKAFADRTRKVASTMFASTPTIAAAVDKAWKQVAL